MGKDGYGSHRAYSQPRPRDSKHTGRYALGKIGDGTALSDTEKFGCAHAHIIAFDTPPTPCDTKHVVMTGRAMNGKS